MRFALPCAVALLLTTPAVAAESATWTTNATSHKTAVGSTFTYTCPAGGRPGKAIYGTAVYTADSGICVAAVHAGQITFAQGGTVKILIGGAHPEYAGTTRHGVTSNSWGSYQWSFTFVSATVTWRSNATDKRTQVGKEFTYDCPAGGNTGASVYGTDLYTTDSSVCAAAVHAGKITAQNGGKVTFVILKGAASYNGTTRHGVTTRSWGSYAWAFSFQ